MNLSKLQVKVHLWTHRVFGFDIAENVQIRAYRFLEEALELVQSTGMTKAEAETLVAYVFNRPVGETPQEVGGVGVTLLAYCNALNIDAFDQAFTEFERCQQPAVITKIRMKQGTKPNPPGVDL